MATAVDTVALLADAAVDMRCVFGRVLIARYILARGRLLRARLPEILKKGAKKY